MSVKPIDIRAINKRSANVYEAVIASAKRGRMINDEIKEEFKAEIDTMPQVEDDFEEKENPDQLRIALEFEKKEKPHIQALDELMKGELEYHYKETNEE